MLLDFCILFCTISTSAPIFVHKTGIFEVPRGVSKWEAKQWKFFNFFDFSYRIRNLLVKSRGFFTGIFVVFVQESYRCKKCNPTSATLGI